MAVFFLLVGLEIKREFLDGQLASWPNRILPGIAAAGGVIVPALIFVAFNYNDPEKVRGWAVPSATDIAFALGVLSLLGSRVPSSLKVFLATLAILDDLAAVIIIAIFYTAEISMPYLGAAFATAAVLFAMNRIGVSKLLPYLIGAAILWFFVLNSGVHATVAGVAAALMIPLKPAKAKPDDMTSPLHTLEHALAKPVAFFIVPVFGFANAGISFTGMTPSIIFDTLPLGIMLGLLSANSLACLVLHGSQSKRVWHSGQWAPAGADIWCFTSLRHRLHDEHFYRAFVLSVGTITSRDKNRRSNWLRTLCNMWLCTAQNAGQAEKLTKTKCPERNSGHFSLCLPICFLHSLQQVFFRLEFDLSGILSRFIPRRFRKKRLKSLLCVCMA